MLFYLYKLVGSLVVPPGLFIVLLVFLSFLAFRKPAKRLCASLLLLFAAVLWFMSTDVGANAITGPIEEMYQRELPPGNGAVTVLMLAGGSAYDIDGTPVQPGIYALERLYTAVNLLKERGGTLILSGGKVYGHETKTEAEVLEAAARKLGWTGKIIKEEKSRTTKENLMYAAAFIDTGSPLVITTSAFHTPRAMRFAARYIPDIKTYPYPTERLTDPLFRGLSSILPNSGALNYSCAGIKEYIGMMVVGM